MKQKYNNTHNSSETKLFSRVESANYNSIENLFYTGKIDMLTFAEKFAPHRKWMIGQILRKIGYTLKGNLIVDIRMPAGVGGYFDLKNTIAINPMLILFGSEKEIAHVLIHESIHAGNYTDGVMVEDESLTETMAQKYMKSCYGSVGLQTGYQPLVEELEDLVGEEMSFQELVETVEEEEADDKFDNILSAIVVKPIMNEGKPEELSWDSIELEVRKKWDVLARLFPRTINKIEGKNKGVHEKATMHASQVKLEGLLEKLADQMINDQPEMLVGVLLRATQNAKDLVTEKDVVKMLWDEGFGYIMDFAEKQMNKYIEEFVKIFNLSKSFNFEIDPLFVAKQFKG